MKRITALTATALLATACGPDFQSGVPGKDMVELKIPQSNALSQGLQASDGKQQLAGQGNLADSYVLTRSATVLVNGGTAFVLGLLGAITDNPPTSREGNTAVWGPYNETLSLNTWKLTVTYLGNQDYSYALDGKHRDADDSTFVSIISGSHHAVSRKVGHGSFLLDWDAAQTLPEHDENVGSAEIAYGNDGADKAVGVLARFENVADEDNPGQRVNANYAFVSVPNVGGAFEFGVRKNANPEAGATLENFTIKSRWLPTGAGRSDAQVSGGDFAANQATYNECWNTGFNSSFLNVSYDSTKNYGVEADDCAIQGAEYADL